VGKLPNGKIVLQFGDGQQSAFLAKNLQCLMVEDGVPSQYYQVTLRGSR